MKVICFHIKGKMAHFRRYYSNSSAISYTVPPRTTLIGIIAGLLGYDRDSYYDDFSVENCDIAVGNLSHIKKIIQKMNLLMIKGTNDLNGSKENHSQCATEFVIPDDMTSGEIDYKVWFRHKDQSINSKLESLLDFPGAFRTFGSCLSLGSAQNLGWIEYEGVFGCEDFEKEEAVDIDSCLPVDMVSDIDINENPASFIMKEELPLEFDGKRVLKRKSDFIMDAKGKAIRAAVKGHVLVENGDRIVWMR